MNETAQSLNSCAFMMNLKGSESIILLVVGALCTFRQVSILEVEDLATHALQFLNDRHASRAGVEISYSDD